MFIFKVLTRNTMRYVRFGVVDRISVMQLRITINTKIKRVAR
jgi:hypothetical protein